jgi:hypothetical protein
MINVQDGSMVSSKYKPEALALGPSSVFQIWKNEIVTAIQ